MPAGAWHRGETEIFAILPHLPGGPVPSEGLTVGPDGTVYTPTFGINSQGAVAGPPHLFSFKSNGQLLYDVALVNLGSPQPSTLLLGLVFQKSSRTLLICDLSNGIVWQADPKTGKATVFMNTRQGSNSGLNAVTFDKAGNVYVSDSIYRRVQCQPDFPRAGAPRIVRQAQLAASHRNSKDAGQGAVYCEPVSGDVHVGGQPVEPSTGGGQ